MTLKMGEGQRKLRLFLLHGLNVCTVCTFVLVIFKIGEEDHCIPGSVEDKSLEDGYNVKLTWAMK